MAEVCRHEVGVLAPEASRQVIFELQQLCKHGLQWSYVTRINVYKILPDLNLRNVYQILYKAANEHLKKGKVSINKVGIPSVNQKHQTPWMSIDSPPPILLFNGVSLEAHEAWSYAKRTNWNPSECDIVEGREQTDSKRTASLKGINASGYEPQLNHLYATAPVLRSVRGNLSIRAHHGLLLPPFHLLILTPGRSQLEMPLLPRHM